MVELTPWELQRRDQLLDKLRARMLTPVEGQELKILLEKERQQAVSGGDILKALAAAFLIGAILSYLFGDDK